MPIAGIVVAAVGGFLIAMWRDRAARRRRAEVGSGQTVRCRALLGLDDLRPRRGRLVLSDALVEWQSLSGRQRVDLRGARVLSASMQPGGSPAREDDVELRLLLPGGTAARARLHEGDGALLVKTLESQPATAVGVAPGWTSSGPGRRVWPAVLFGLAALWLVAWVLLVLTGRTVEATVVANDGEGYCAVAWTDPDGAPRDAEVDCDDEAAGSTRQIWALGPPFRDDAVDREWTIYGVLAGTAILAAPGGYGTVLDVRDRRRWRRRQQTGERAVLVGDEPGDLPQLTEQDVVAAADETAVAYLARLAPHAARQVRDDWVDADSPDGASLRLRPLDVGKALVGPVFTLAMVALLTMPAPYRWVVLQTQPTAVAEATSTGEVVVDGMGPVPEEVQVRFRDIGGVERTADVATLSPLPEGVQRTVVYAVDSPGWARIDGDGDGSSRGALLALVGGLIGFGWAGYRVVGLARTQRLLHGTAGAPPRRALGLLTGDPAADPVLLVCDPVVLPVQLLAVPLLQPLPAAVVAAAAPLRLQVHGALRDGEPLVSDLTDIADAAQARLLPAGPVFAPEGEELLWLLDSTRYLTEDFDESDTA
jgi:hypothetical protein